MEVGELLPRLSILTVPRNGGLFLLPFSGGYPRLTLSAILPCDARTFLTVLPFGMIPRGRPTELPFYYIIVHTKSQDIFSKDDRYPMTYERICPQPSSRSSASQPANVRAKSRQAVLSALEYEHPISQSGIVSRTDLCPNTVRAVCRRLIRDGILTRRHGRDQSNRRAAELLAFVPYPVLPILDVSDRELTWCLYDTLGVPVLSTRRYRHSFHTPEDDLTALMGQVSALLRVLPQGDACRVPLQAPALLLSRFDSPWPKLFRRIENTEPSLVLPKEEAVASALPYHPMLTQAHSVLYLCTDTAGEATLFLRSTSAPTFFTAPCTDSLTATLRQALGQTLAYTPAWWSFFEQYLSDLLRFIRPGAIVLEMPNSESLPSSLTEMLSTLPATLYVPPTSRLPSLAHCGVLRRLRNTLWDHWESLSPKSHHSERISPS